MESERPIEKLLRAFAKKRREQAGAPFELSATARRRLQREVEQQHDKPEKERGFFSLVIPLPRLAFVLSVVAIIALLAAMILPALSKAKSKAQGTTALAQRRQAELQHEMDRDGLPTPATAPVASAMPTRTLADLERPQRQEELPASSPQAPVVMTTKPTPKEVVFDGFASHVAVTNGYFDAASAVRGNLEGDTLTITPSTSTLFYANSSIWAGQTHTGAADQSITLSLRDLRGATTLGDEASAMPSVNMAISSANAPVVSAEGSKSVTGIPNVKQSYQRVFQSSSNREDMAGSMILSSFSVEWSGAIMTVHDADGSVYTGTVQPANFAMNTFVKYGDAGIRSGIDFPGTNNQFRVEGTNVVSLQPIVFFGSFIAKTNTSVRDIGGAGGGALMPLGLNKFTISGSVTTEGKQTEIQAAPVAP